MNIFSILLVCRIKQICVKNLEISKKDNMV
nr:MAG TPA: hypothetical protein [Caudoviricetes sp.]